MAENEKRKRAPRRNYEKELAELTMYCRCMVTVLDKAAPELHHLAGAKDAYADVLKRLEPKA